MRRFKDNDRGATAVLVACCVVSLITFSGLVIDGGNAYSQRRQMQNSADSSSLAGANALQKYKQNPAVGASSIYTAALGGATSNDAKATTFQCFLVQLDNAGNELGSTPCPQSDSGSVPANSYKVRVKVDSDHGTHFMSIVGITAFNARGGAAASLQAASIANSPFMLCASPTATGHSPQLLIPDPTDPTGWEINTGQAAPAIPTAIGVTYEMWGNDIKDGGRNCGLGNSFRGLVDNSQRYDIPGDWDALHGNKNGMKVPLPLIGGCVVDNDESKVKDIPVGCEFAVPLCPTVSAGFQLYCVKVGRFKLTKVENHDIEAVFLGGGVANSGEGNGVPGSGDVVVIKLTE